MNATVRRTASMAAFLLAGIIAVCWHTETRAAGPRDPKAIPTYPNQPETKTASSWDQKAAATYLDQRQGWSLNLIEICFQDDASFRVRS